MKPALKRYAYITGFLGFALVLAVAGMWAFTSFERQKYNAEIASGAALYADNCASCHGADLKGEADWQTQNSDGTLPAPPHDEDGHTWHHSDQLLFNYIKLGGEGAMEKAGLTGFNSGMPAFEAALSDADINAVLSFIKSRWPEETQIIQQERNMVSEY